MRFYRDWYRPDLMAVIVVGGWRGVRALLALALTVKHNGWLYYAGGDQLWHYSGAYLLAHGHLPPAYVGYGWSVLLAPLASAAPQPPPTGPGALSRLASNRG